MTGKDIGKQVMEAHKGHTSGKASPTKPDPLASPALCIHWESTVDTEQGGRGTHHHAKLGDRDCVPEGAALEQSLGGRRDERGNSGQPQCEEVLR